MSDSKDASSEIGCGSIILAFVIVMICPLILTILADNDEEYPSNTNYEDGNVRVYEERNGNLEQVDEYNEYDDAIIDYNDYQMERGRF